MCEGQRGSRGRGDRRSAELTQTVELFPLWTTPPNGTVPCAAASPTDSTTALCSSQPPTKKERSVTVSHTWASLLHVQNYTDMLSCMTLHYTQNTCNIPVMFSLYIWVLVHNINSVFTSSPNMYVFEQTAAIHFLSPPAIHQVSFYTNCSTY